MSKAGCAIESASSWLILASLAFISYSLEVYALFSFGAHVLIKLFLPLFHLGRMGPYVMFCNTVWWSFIQFSHVFWLVVFIMSICFMPALICSVWPGLQFVSFLYRQV